MLENSSVPTHSPTSNSPSCVPDEPAWCFLSSVLYFWYKNPSASCISSNGFVPSKQYTNAGSSFSFSVLPCTSIMNENKCSSRPQPFLALKPAPINIRIFPETLQSELNDAEYLMHAILILFLSFYIIFIPCHRFKPGRRAPITYSELENNRDTLI